VSLRVVVPVHFSEVHLLGSTVSWAGKPTFTEFHFFGSFLEDFASNHYMKRWILLLSAVAALFLPVSSTFAAGLIIIDDPKIWPGPPPRPIPPPWPPTPRPHPFAPLEVRSVKAQTHINDQVAVTSVDQEFYNPNSVRLEGTFVFPVPKGAQLDKFKMEIDGKSVEAELLPSKKARDIFDDIVRKMRDPALLEYGEQDVFKIRIFPIEPNSPKRITISYTQFLKQDAGLVSYVLPLSAEKYSTKPVKTVSVKVELDSKRPIKSIYSPSHSVEIKRDGANRATAGYEASEVLPSEDFALFFSPEQDELGVNLLTSKTGSEDGYFLLLASPGVDVKEKAVVLKDVVFVLDTSGSMAGKKLDQAKKALSFCVENLNDGDRFEILRFSTEVEAVFDKLVEANRQNRTRAGDFIKDLKPIGGTAIDEALKRALALQTGKDRPFVVIFLTDGQPTVGNTDPKDILANVKKEDDGHTRIFCFGIGTDVNTHLLDKITEQTRATSQYVLPEEDLEVKLSSFYSKIKEPVLADPSLKFTGDVRVTKLYPSPLPDLFKGEQLVLVGRYTGHGASAAVIDGKVNGASKSFSYDVKFPEESSENSFIPRLWATRRVGYLLDEIRLHGESSELRDEVTDLARKYGIVTPYTAYLIVEDESRRDVPTPMRSMRNLEEDRRAQQAARSGWDSFKSDTAGASAVGGARLGSALKSAESAPAAVADSHAISSYSFGTAGRGSVGGLGGTGARSSSASMADNERLLQYSQQSQFVAGKNFFLNGSQWIDSEVQKQPAAKRIRIQFGSSEYFELSAKNPKALPWLSLGQSVQFFLNGTTYEIYAAD
jgi:Ca-activated chloride channel homolog